MGIVVMLYYAMIRLIERGAVGFSTRAPFKKGYFRVLYRRGTMGVVYKKAGTLRWRRGSSLGVRV